MTRKLICMAPKCHVPQEIPPVFVRREEEFLGKRAQEVLGTMGKREFARTVVLGARKQRAEV